MFRDNPKARLLIANNSLDLLVFVIFFIETGLRFVGYLGNLTFKF